MKFYIVDCFAQQKYQGNQLAVFIPDRPISTDEMQQIAREMNFSETSFILSGKQPDGGYDVKIFTPDVEVPFAGHPTLGTAYVISRYLECGSCDKVILNMSAGQIPVEIRDGSLTMSQNQPEFGQLTEPATAAALINADAKDICENLPVQIVSTGLPCMVIPMKTPEAVSRCTVNHSLFQNFIDNVCKCNLLMFAREDDHIKARLFMDDPGFLEDPATGSANGNLAGYLLKYDYFGSSDISYSVSQGSEIGRPSLLNISASLHDGEYTINVGGGVFSVAEGTWL